jgi:hypothetical protein
MIRIAIGTTFEIDGVKPSIAGDTLSSIVELAKQDRMKRLGIVGHALKTEKNPASLALRRAVAAKNLLVARGTGGEDRVARGASRRPRVLPTSGSRRSAAAVRVLRGSRDRGPSHDMGRSSLRRSAAAATTSAAAMPDPPARGPGHPCKQP